MKKSKSILGNGVLIFLLIGAFFLLMELFGLSDVAFLRLFNIVFVVYGVNRTIKSRIIAGEVDYLGNFGAGVLASFIGVFLSVIALWIYLGAITGVEHINQLAHSVILGQPDSLPQFCIALMVEGLSSSVVISLIIMQRWKNVKAIGKTP